MLVAAIPEGNENEVNKMINLCFFNEYTNTANIIIIEVATKNSINIPKNL
ncbi:hypothetical protein HUN03_00225 [Mycoplasmopsis anatis]|uniref:Uncharacterized protein n=1 Tax=Mycoplasmopsis anatis TaxID=171279 RepID=A0A9Q3L814_9BACT|nr:hypothetical protein [Mycoplasmopsis anatis]MBW0594935.1 hypothetical protein [Mycoplasmopsis anatis]MBW0595554.1 hypothetical protein [Mycoplasmopsis anatis]MBW0595823.1 hypothetical protein [Mycoplasmopsis anatis]MBW0596727.1 hypothetical protein [Mycoplasmopsis anatis]MBW0597258.1 hypothetical protein [Mycoplasmopsis anatis]